MDNWKGGFLEMEQLRRIITAILAGALCMGMSLGVLAQEQPSEQPLVPLEEAASSGPVLASSFILGAPSNLEVSPQVLDAFQQAEEEAQQELPSDWVPSSFHGVWQGSFHTPLPNNMYFDDPVELHYIDHPEVPRLLLKIKSYEANYVPVAWTLEEGTLNITINEGPWTALATLSLSDSQTLSGTYTQYGKTYDLALHKTADEPEDLSQQPQFIFEGEGNPVWLERLRKYPAFNQGASQIPFTYELDAREKEQEFLTELGFQEQMFSDELELMRGMMDLVCDQVPHDGASGMPEEATDSLSVLRYAREKGGIECRGLSIILSEVLRACGIPAKPVMCIPYTDPCEDCHVVVHAWSSTLGRWVMLDPTYRLMLRDLDGNYLGIPEIRQALVDGTPLVPTDTAGHNGAPFYMSYYRAYMEKNMFRFSTLTNACFEGEKAPGNRWRMLAPKNYTVQYQWSRPEIVTTDASAFWAPPF